MKHFNGILLYVIYTFTYLYLYQPWKIKFELFKKQYFFQWMGTD